VLQPIHVQAARTLDDTLVIVPHNPRQRKGVCQHGSSPSRSRALSCSASSTQEDPVAGQLQLNHSFTLRVVTTPHSLVPPSDALASLSRPTDPAGDAPVGASGNTPVNAPDVALADAPGHALIRTPSAEPIPIPPSPAAFASTPVDSSGYMPVNASVAAAVAPGRF
jgi:hypothetical protein